MKKLQRDDKLVAYAKTKGIEIRNHIASYLLLNAIPNFFSKWQSSLLTSIPGPRHSASARTSSLGLCQIFGGSEIDIPTDPNSIRDDISSRVIYNSYQAFFFTRTSQPWRDIYT